MCGIYFLNIIIYTTILSIFYTTLEILNRWSNNLENDLDNCTSVLAQENINEHTQKMVYDFKVKTYQTGIQQQYTKYLMSNELFDPVTNKPTQALRENLRKKI